MDEPVAAEAPAATMNIVETAVAAEFNTLVAAVQAAELVDVLTGPGPFTVFAPTDEAFAALPEGTVETLLMPENRDQLVAVLTYHVVSGKVMAADVVGLTSAPTVQGADIAISVVDGAVKINDATVTSADVEASNGVIHVIDQVILPPQD
ncbi:MAG: fasciclin domain-containing protein [Rhodothermales bacterium]|nr:fasciclin domain-containing protein [Rhodothermales bacterium]